MSLALLRGTSGPVFGEFRPTKGDSRTMMPDLPDMSPPKLSNLHAVGEPRHTRRTPLFRS